MTTNVAVLLTVHNRKQKTLKCLKELFNQKIPVNYFLDVFLTDDGCTDGTGEAVSKEYPKVSIITGDGNLFWNRGMYYAWDKASQTKDYDYYLWLNDDTILLEGGLHGLLTEAAEYPDAIIVGSTHSSISSNELTYGGYALGRLLKPNGTLQKCQTFNGNIVLIPKSVFQSIGNLDWTYRHAIGDLDYGLRSTKAGKDVFVSREYRGICDKNARPPKWTIPTVPFKERWKNYYSPLGYGQPGPFFHFNRRHFGIIRAIRVYVSNHIRLFFPWIISCSKGTLIGRSGE